MYTEHHYQLRLEREKAGPMHRYIPDPVPLPPVVREIQPARRLPQPDGSKLRELEARMRAIDAEYDAVARTPVPLHPPLHVRCLELAGDYRPVAPPDLSREEFHRTLDATNSELRTNMSDMLHGAPLPKRTVYPERISALHYVNQNMPNAARAEAITRGSSPISSTHRSASYLPPAHVRGVGYIGRGEVPLHY
eukprot:TRINITY_DN17197_c0_g1_i1.p1 TRINITY_DN17197_c0_g1~~TRINITY_DN17197_c0_g1_i1.p1  ORF type:complete len:193 (-),score=18.22 TRINITY_DN17197_c0_g1_i1:173-751(-)